MSLRDILNGRTKNATDPNAPPTDVAEKVAAGMREFHDAFSKQSAEHAAEIEHLITTHQDVERRLRAHAESMEARYMEERDARLRLEGEVTSLREHNHHLGESIRDRESMVLEAQHVVAQTCQPLVDLMQKMKIGNLRSAASVRASSQQAVDEIHELIASSSRPHQEETPTDDGAGEVARKFAPAVPV